MSSLLLASPKGGGRAKTFETDRKPFPEFSIDFLLKKEKEEKEEKKERKRKKREGEGISGRNRAKG